VGLGGGGAISQKSQLNGENRGTDKGGAIQWGAMGGTEGSYKLGGQIALCDRTGQKNKEAGTQEKRIKGPASKKKGKRENNNGGKGKIDGKVVWGKRRGQRRGAKKLGGKTMRRGGMP